MGNPVAVGVVELAVLQAVVALVETAEVVEPEMAAVDLDLDMVAQSLQGQMIGQRSHPVEAAVMQLPVAAMAPAEQQVVLLERTGLTAVQLSAVVWLLQEARSLQVVGQKPELGWQPKSGVQFGRPRLLTYRILAGRYLYNLGSLSRAI